MALDIHMEDYLRLSLHYAANSTATNPFEAAQAATVFANRYQRNREQLTQTDADRAFGLVCKATEIIDYQLPFSSEEEGQALIDTARGFLDEAIALDATCWDAKRMLAAASAKNPSEYQHFLAEHKATVKQSCERAAGRPTMTDPEMLELEQTLALRPYLRWLAAEAVIALVCGRYRLSVELCKEALALEENDPADVTFTLALALAKLEDGIALEHALAAHPRNNSCAWFELARMALYFKLGNLEAAHDCVCKIIATYPNAEVVLALQNDIPDGIFARLLVEPGSQDELILAVSEATVLLQEGCDCHERGTMGSWLFSLPEIKDAATLDFLDEAGQDSGEAL